jgi:hypothetical protein
LSFTWSAQHSSSLLLHDITDDRPTTASPSQAYYLLAAWFSFAKSFSLTSEGFEHMHLQRLGM